MLAQDTLVPIGTLRRKPENVDLFAFSAAIGMAHRIHYDGDYVRNVEGRQNIVVQGPLQAAYMCQLLQEWAAQQGMSAVVERLKYRHHAPVYAGTELVVGGELTSFDSESQRAECTVWTKAPGDEKPRTEGTATLSLRPPEEKR